MLRELWRRWRLRRRTDDREATERVVTLLFLDIANFSVVAEQAAPKQVFLHLKSLFREIGRTVEAHGGLVDKTLGDGVLAYFAEPFDRYGDTHADHAIRCALDLQRRNVRRCLAAAEQGDAILPFRIGLNTGAVYRGDLGHGMREDVTLIGNGVNYAQRLEAACDHHSILLSAATLAEARSFDIAMPGFTQRLIPVKHSEEPLAAIELDPFHGEPRTREAALEAFRRSYKLERREPRWIVDTPELVPVVSPFGDGALVDYSPTGFCLRLGSYLAKGIVFDVTLGTLGERVKVEVRWGRASANGYLHGLKIVNLSEVQLRALRHYLDAALGPLNLADRAG